jgi:hypothetical protein
MTTMTTALASLLAAAAPLAVRAQAHAHHADPAPPPAPDSSEGTDHRQIDHDGMDHPAGPGHGAQGNRRTAAIAAMTMPIAGNCPPTGPGEIAPDCHRLPAFAEGSGTARLPGREGGMHGLHVAAGGWMLMAHGHVTLNATDHMGPRGDDLVYATSMFMLSGERAFAGGRLQLRAMMSLEPTMAARGYPNLFATGETVGGEPLVDRQHPHDLFMELAARLDIDLSERASLFLYGGPVAEPALGPSAFMHRGSAANNPEPPITHHWFDSTHITYGVVTAGLASPHWQIEASAFRGAEPDEDRWDIETPRLDSWSVRASWSPTPNWTAQLSHGFLKEPESVHAGENAHRTTASLHYADGRLAAMAAFSAKNRSPGGALTAWLLEADYDLSERHSLFARLETVTNDELAPDHDDPLHDRRFRIGKAQLGYAWHRPIGDGPVGLTLGGSANLYDKPAALDPLYGKSPWGYTLFARLSLGH